MRLATLLIAAVLVPRFAHADLEEAHRLLTEWQLEDALEMAQELLAASPNDPQVWALAARVQHHRGEHLSALSLLQAVEATEDADHILGSFAPLVESSARYQAHFDTVETPHFRIRYLNKDEIVAFYAKDVLEKAYTNVAGDLQLLPAERGEKIVVEIYPDARGLAGATGLTINEIETSGTIAVCKFHRLMITSPLATANGYDWGDTLAHEFAHLVISKKSHNTVPIWLHEGIAKYYESRWDGAIGRALEPYGEKLLAEAVRSSDFVTFDEMHPSMAKLPSQEKASLAFAEVFTVIEYLTKKHGSDAVPNVLALTGEGLPLERALRRVFGAGLAGLEASWRKYLSKRGFREVPGAKPKRIVLATSEKQAQSERPLEEMEDREVHDYSRLGELLQLRGHGGAAIVEYEKAYARAGVRYATLINRLARAYVSAKRVDEALQMLDRLFGAHPDDSDAHLLAGRIQYSRQSYTDARSHFEAVRMQNPFNPEVHMALARLYDAEGKNEAAEQERHFLELSRKPRPTRTYDLPSPPAGDARVSIVAPGWRPVRIDGALPEATPAWARRIAAGPHSVEYVDDKGVARVRSFTVAAGDNETLVLD